MSLRNSNERELSFKMNSRLPGIDVKRTMIFVLNVVPALTKYYSLVLQAVILVVHFPSQYALHM